MTNQPTIGSKVHFKFSITLLDDIIREGVAEVSYETVIGTDLGSGIRVLSSNHYQPGDMVECRNLNLTAA